MPLAFVVKVLNVTHQHHGVCRLAFEPVHGFKQQLAFAVKSIALF